MRVVKIYIKGGYSCKVMMEIRKDMKMIRSKLMIQSHSNNPPQPLQPLHNPANNTI